MTESGDVGVEGTLLRWRAVEIEDLSHDTDGDEELGGAAAANLALGTGPGGVKLPWALRLELELGGFYPASHHVFRLQVANAEGWSLPSDVSEPGRLLPEPPLQCDPPRVVVSGADAVICTWTQPHSNGAYVSRYRLQRALVPPGSGALTPLVLRHLKFEDCVGSEGVDPLIARDTFRSLQDHFPLESSARVANPALGVADPVVDDGVAEAEEAAAASEAAASLRRGRGMKRPPVAAALGAKLASTTAKKGAARTTAVASDGYGLDMAAAVSGLQPGNRYCFRVVAANSVGATEGLPSTDVRTSGTRIGL